MLRQAHEGRLLTEDYLVELQNSIVSNPFDKAVAFRHEQNHLHIQLGVDGCVSRCVRGSENLERLAVEQKVLTFSSRAA